MRRERKSRFHVTSFCVLAAVAIGLLGWNAFSEKDNEEHPPVKMELDQQALPEQLKRETSYSAMLKKVTPSVVNIFTTRTVQMRQLPQFQDPFYRRFFGEGPEQQPRSRQEPSLGSGVIISTNGYILTNNHVIADADEIKVALASGNKLEYDAKLIGTDPKTDIAVLKIDAEDLPAVVIADSDLLEVGDMVFAVGNPFGVGQTVTRGIVSAVGRGNLGITDYEDFIQTDASINPGNSGGALVDAAGRLVGINTAILSRTGGNNGIGFAVPINMARSVTERLTQYGRVVRGYLGVVIQPVTEQLAERFKLDNTRGALISDIMPDSAAADAGMKAGDVIVSFNGREVNSVRDLRLRVEVTPPNTKVPVEISRDGKKQELTVTLKEMPGEAVAGGRMPGDPGEPGFLQGVELQDLTPRIRMALELPADLAGVLVAAVAPDSAAAKAGLSQGNVIIEINRKEVESARHAFSILREAKSDSVLLYVWSEGQRRYVAIDESKER